MTIALTPSGRPITCDGCGAFIEVVREDMKHPVLYPHQWAETDVIYIVCRPMPDGSQPCLDLAQLADELFEATKCRKPGCTGRNCQTASA